MRRDTMDVVRESPLLNVPDASFYAWAEEWMALARFYGRSVPNLEERIDQVVKLWRMPVPGEGRWKRARDERLLEPGKRYCRGNLHTTQRGEHKIEYEILVADPAKTETTSLGMRLVDGVNAVPLAKDPGGRRKGNVEADMLLLVTAKNNYRLQLVEVKNRSNHAWYAAVEVLRQARLFVESPQSQLIAHDRLPRLKLEERLPLTAIVLAPREFYSAAGRRRLTVKPARQLLERMKREVQVDGQLACWDPELRRIEPL